MNRSLVVVVTMLAMAPGAHALVAGDACSLKATLPVIVQSGGTNVPTTFDAGTDVRLLYVEDSGGRGRISNGAVRGVVTMRELEAACAGTLRLCRATSAFSLFERNRSDSRSWPVSPGTAVSVLRAGKVWAHLLVAEKEGFATVVDVNGRCSADDGGATEPSERPHADDASGAPVEDVERGEGPGILVLPFVLDDGAPVPVADRLAATFDEHLRTYRPDVGHLPLLGSRTVAWKDHVDGAIKRARAVGLAYALLARVSPEPAGKADGGGLVVSIAVIDVASGKTLKGVRAHPTSLDDDSWSDPALASLLPAIAPAPGGRLPSVHPTTATTTTEPASSTTPKVATTGEGWSAPWFANPWGYLALGAAIGSGVGAWYVGQAALEANAAANATPSIDDKRAERRADALQQAVIADGLTATSALSGIAAVAIFAARVGIGE
jgi:hypothetical protein